MADRRLLLNRVSQFLNEAREGSNLVLEAKVLGNAAVTEENQQELLSRMHRAIVLGLQEIAKDVALVSLDAGLDAGCSWDKQEMVRY